MVVATIHYFLHPLTAMTEGLASFLLVIGGIVVFQFNLDALVDFLFSVGEDACQHKCIDTSDSRCIYNMSLPVFCTRTGPLCLDRFLRLCAPFTSLSRSLSQGFTNMYLTRWMWMCWVSIGLEGYSFCSYSYACYKERLARHWMITIMSQHSGLRLPA